jgi:hypothetical protein
MDFNLKQSGPWIGVGGICMLFFVAFPAVLPPLGFAPWWGVLMIFGLLIFQAIIVARWAKTHPDWCAYVPFVGLMAYFALVFVGLQWWNWRIAS